MATGVSKSHYLELELLNAVLRGAAFTPPAAVYVALFTAAPTDAGGGTEVTGGAYARTAATFAAAVSGGASSGSTIANSADVVFPTATAAWGTVVAVGIYDAASAGNLLYFGNLTTSQAVATGNQFRFPATTGLVVTED